MNEINGEESKKKPLEVMKEGFQKFGVKTEEIIKDLGEGARDILKKTKKRLEITADNLNKNIKENKTKRREKEIQNWTNSKIGQGIMRIIKKDVEEIKSDTSQIKDDTTQIKEELAKILNTLEVIDFKADNIENYLSDIMPKLEQSIEHIDNLEEYIKDHIGSKWKKLKRDWLKYKNEEITKGQFLMQGFNILGRSFISVFRR